MVKDHDCEIFVANALSMKSIASLMSISMLPLQLQEKVNELGLELIVGQLSTLTLQLTIFEGIKEAQELDLALVRIRDEVLEGKNSAFSLSNDRILKFK